jgi:hypothetical protein
MPESEYDKLVAMGLITERKSRPVLTEQERKERRRRQTRLMMEARRRAEKLLVVNHKAEFDLYYKIEKDNLQRDPDYAVPELQPED